MTTVVTVNSRGGITVPKKLRAALGLNAVARLALRRDLRHADHAPRAIESGRHPNEGGAAIGNPPHFQSVLTVEIKRPWQASVLA